MAMKAIAQSEYGSAEVLRVDDIPKPTPQAGEALVRVYAVGVGPEVWHPMTGLPYLVRVMGYGLRRPKNPVPGRDLAGIVEAVGEGVTTLHPGDQVYGTGDGTLAEYARAPAERLAPKPANLSFVQAAAVPVSGCAALLAVRDEGRIQAGQSVLVVGASGGVGSFAVQLAKSFGAEVTGVCSGEKADLVRSLGVDQVIDYTREDFTEGEQKYDLIVDTAGRRPLSQLRRALVPKGTLVIVGGEGGDRVSGGFIQRQLGAMAVSPFVGHRLRAVISKERTEELLYLRDVIEAGSVTPLVGQTFPLEEAAKALSDEDEGHGRGKKVVTIVTEPEPRRPRTREDPREWGPGGPDRPDA